MTVTADMGWPLVLVLVMAVGGGAASAAWRRVARAGREADRARLREFLEGERAGEGAVGTEGGRS